MTKSERDKWNGNCFSHKKNLDIRNNLESKLLKQHWAPFCNLPGAVISHVERLFRAKKDRKNVKFHLTRHWLKLANQWLDSRDVTGSHFYDLDWPIPITTNLWPNPYPYLLRRFGTYPAHKDSSVNFASWGKTLHSFISDTETHPPGMAQPVAYAENFHGGEVSKCQNFSLH